MPDPDENKHYVVSATEFPWEGRTLHRGDTLEARGTNEILTHVALGNLVLVIDAAEQLPDLELEPEPEPEPQAEMLPDAEPPPRVKRKYVRRMPR